MCRLAYPSNPQISAFQSRRASDKSPFVRTQVAIYFVSLLICNLFQAIGGLFSIAWIVEDHVYAGAACTAQAILKQMGSVCKVLFFAQKSQYSHLTCSQIGAAIFSFVIGAHTFSLLFLGRKYSDRTCYITLFASWGLLLLESCIENFVLAQPKEGRPFYGVAGYWCWITEMYPIERFTTAYLFMFVSAVFSFILYSLVFFRLRGNISLSAGNRFSFHRRPKVITGRTSDGTYIATDDRRVESHLTALAKPMLWYPIAYTILVLPMAACRFTTFTSKSVPFAATIFTASLFMLHGFINAVLFCTTQDILPRGWGQRFGLTTAWGTKGGDVHQASRTNDTWFTATRAGTVGIATTIPEFRSAGVEKDAVIKYAAEPGISTVRFDTPASLNPPPQAHGGNGQRASLRDYYNRRFSSSAPQDTTTSISFEIDEGDNASTLSVGTYTGTIAKNVEWEVPRHPRHSYRGLESGLRRPALALGASLPVHPSATALPANTGTHPYDVLNRHQSHSPFLGNWRFWRQR